jgi:hypothetical protein
VCKLLLEQVGRPSETGTRAAAWAKGACWKALQQSLPALAKAPPPPMTVGWRGGAIELSLSLPIALAKLALISSGTSPGVSFRQRMTGPGSDHEELQAGLVWTVRNPEDHRCIQALHRALAERPSFAGILPSDRPDKIGVRFWGERPSVIDRTWLCDILGTTYVRPTTRVRVRGYRSDFGLPQAEGKRSTAQVEVEAIFGLEAELVACTHMQKSGLRNPVWDLTIRGIPPTWPGEMIPSMDSREGDKRWHRCTQTQRSTPLQSMGPSAFLPPPLEYPVVDEVESDANSVAMEEDPTVKIHLQDQFQAKD